MLRQSYSTSAASPISCEGTALCYKMIQCFRPPSLGPESDMQVSSEDHGIISRLGGYALLFWYRQGNVPKYSRRVCPYH